MLVKVIEKNARIKDFIKDINFMEDEDINLTLYDWFYFSETNQFFSSEDLADPILNLFEKEILGKK